MKTALAMTWDVLALVGITTAIAATFLYSWGYFV